MGLRLDPISRYIATLIKAVFFFIFFFFWQQCTSCVRPHPSSCKMQYNTRQWFHSESSACPVGPIMA